MVPGRVARLPSCHLAQLGFAVEPSICSRPATHTRPARRACCATTSPISPRKRPTVSGSQRRPRRRHRLERRDAPRGLPGAGLPRARHRADRCGAIAIERGIQTVRRFFDPDVVERVGRVRPPRLMTATNVFAHIQDVHAIVEAVARLVGDEGTFVTESHYLGDCSKRCNTTRSTTSISALFAREPDRAAREARPRDHPRQTHSDARRLDSRLRRESRSRPVNDER